MLNYILLSGDAGFPLNGMYQRPSSPEVADLMRQYFLQVNLDIVKCSVGLYLYNV